MDGDGVDPTTHEQTHALLAEARRCLGDDVSWPVLEVTDAHEDLLPSRLPALAAVGAAAGAALSAISVLHGVRNGVTAPGVHLDGRHVAAAARSERHARLQGRPAGEMFAPLSRFWEARDGWVRTHANYPWHRRRALDVLGCPDDVEAVARAIAERTVLDLEDAFASAGALAFGVRDHDEWLAHPQGAAVDVLPLLEIAGRDHVTTPLGPRPLLHGVRVLDLTRVIAGPVATRTLAAWGADVLRVDSPRMPELPAQTVDTLQGKRSALLDLDRTEDRCRLEELLAQAHVLVHAYRPGALERHGLDADGLQERHSHLVTVGISAWGWVGPWAHRRGFDSLVQAASGIARIESADGRRPGALPAQALDHATGHLAAAAVATALARIEVGHGPADASLSLAQTAAWLQRAPRRREQDGAERVTDQDPPMVSLAAGSRTVDVVAPPGRIGDWSGRWARAGVYGGDDPTFATA